MVCICYTYYLSTEGIVQKKKNHFKKNKTKNIQYAYLSIRSLLFVEQFSSYCIAWQNTSEIDVNVEATLFFILFHCKTLLVSEVVFDMLAMISFLHVKSAAFALFKHNLKQ